MDDDSVYSDRTGEETIGDEYREELFTYIAACESLLPVEYSTQQREQDASEVMETANITPNEAQVADTCKTEQLKTRRESMNTRKLL